MLIDVAHAFHGDPAEWAGKPYVWVLWCCVQLRQRERVRAWQARMHRYEAAYLMAKAMNEPEKFCGEEREKILEEARAKVTAMPDPEWDAGNRAFDEAFASGTLKPGHVMKVH